MSEIDNTNAIIRKFEPVIEGLSYNELSILNQMVVERIRLMQKAEDLVSMSKFNIGDRVSWCGKNGFIYVGIIQRINHKETILCNKHGCSYAKHTHFSPK